MLDPILGDGGFFKGTTKEASFSSELRLLARVLPDLTLSFGRAPEHPAYTAR